MAFLITRNRGMYYTCLICPHMLTAESAFASGKASDISTLMDFINTYVVHNNLGDVAPPHAVKWQLEAEYGVALPDAKTPGAFGEGSTVNLHCSEAELKRVFAALKKDPHLEN